MAKPFAYDLNCINADGMMPEDLADFATHLEVLLEYAGTKRMAMLLRSVGKVNDAMRFERGCEAIHECLPSNWQW